MACYTSTDDWSNVDNSKGQILLLLCAGIMKRECDFSHVSCETRYRKWKSKSGRVKSFYARQLGRVVPLSVQNSQVGTGGEGAEPNARWQALKRRPLHCLHLYSEKNCGGGKHSEPMIRTWGLALSSDRWHPKGEQSHQRSEMWNTELFKAEPGARGCISE